MSYEYPTKEAIFDRRRQLWEEYAKNWAAQTVDMDDASVPANERPSYIRYLGDEWGTVTSTMQVVEEYILAFVNSQSRVAEIGCGGGRIASKVASRVKSLHCCDVSQNMISRCRRALETYDNVTYNLIESKNNCFGDEAGFDFIYAFDVFVHLDVYSLWEYLQLIKTSLTEKGLALVHTANLTTDEGWREFISQGVCTAPDDLYFASPDLVRCLINRAGLSVVKESKTRADNFYLARDYIAIVSK